VIADAEDIRFACHLLPKGNMTMSYDFNADDIFEMAEQMERNGAKFYKSASENVTDPQYQKFLIQLSQMEEQHEKTYKEMRVLLNEKEKVATIFDPEHEAVLYLRALADTRVFFQKTIDLTSMKEILKAAIEAEKDSIVFYLGMKDVVPESLGKNRIDGIIKEEMGHIRLLSKELVSLK
jgi:rubrerythrin